MGDASPRDVLQDATELITSTDWATSFWWCRGAALLARQALELSVGQFWEAHDPGMEAASMRAQFLCLHDVELEARVIADARIAYDLLSRACHYHPYELQPTREEVVHWVAAVERFHEALVAHAMRLPQR
ncbi:hypothetical protein TBR22_A51810 [Luteitalea sp. TBR-22]|uniref:hypothetical protein n=1 Tax=Luteitalea sp. TBR-22 TaxID=2802971 RepID=UPI001AF10CDC|nr:hypothetical protein [Luteitalea sp. TBR-22]BCS35946.1 hypothetical protein TBR22_A51810 [Luteitalea sp. TBR-22]